MNLFVLDRDPRRAAAYHSDRHVGKMLLETAQLLCTAHHVADGDAARPGLYKPVNRNHPCNIWVRSSTGNYRWAWRLGTALCREFSFRFGRMHASAEVIARLRQPPRRVPQGPRTEFPQAMPDSCKRPDAVDAYRTYYRLHKARFADGKPAVWTRRRIPRFMAEAMAGN